MGIRAGQGYGVPKPKRRVCPECGKKGVGLPHLAFGTWVRGCQYCGMTWSDAAWKIAREQARCKTNPGGAAG